MDGKLAYVIGIVVVAVVIVAALAAGGVFAAAKSAGRGTVAFQLTDPPVVPNGTQALVVSYTSAQVHATYANGTSAWIGSGQSGTVDLLSLVNLTQTIATISVGANAMINMARFNITSASITINGTTYPVIMPNPIVTANVTSNGTINSTSGVLVDLSPTIVSIYTSNSTVFVMVPSVRAVIVGNVPQASLSVGTKSSLTTKDRGDLERIRPNITITGESLSQNGSITSLSITVMDNSNQSVALKHVLLSGLPNVFILPGGWMTNVTTNVTAQTRPMFVRDIVPQEASVGVGLNGSVNGTYGNVGMEDKGGISAVIDGQLVNVSSTGTIAANAGAYVGMSSSERAALPMITDEGLQIRRFGVLNFIVLANGTLALPFDSNGYYGRICGPSPLENVTAGVNGSGAGVSAGTAIYCTPFNETGYTLAPGQSVTLTFRGNIAFGGSCEFRYPPTVQAGAVLPAVCPLDVMIVPGRRYLVTVTGTRGARATAVVNATGTVPIYANGTANMTNGTISTVGMKNGTVVNVSANERIDNFLVLGIDSSTVTGVFYNLYPVAFIGGVRAELHVGDTVGYSCDGTLARLSGMGTSNGHLTAAFVVVSSARSRYGCPM